MRVKAAVLLISLDQDRAGFLQTRVVFGIRTDVKHSLPQSTLQALRARPSCPGRDTRYDHERIVGTL